MTKIMSRVFMSLAVALLGLVTLAPMAQAAPARGFYGGGFRGGVIVGGFYGPGWYGPGWWGWGYPGWYGYGWGPGYGPYAAGTVKIKTPMKDAQVYVDGGYAGLAAKLKKFQLRPGEHSIELRDPSGHTFYQQEVNVLPGRTIEIQPHA
jgi:PEGA domain